MRSPAAQAALDVVEQAVTAAQSGPKGEMEAMLLAATVASLGVIIVTLEEIKDAISPPQA